MQFMPKDIDQRREWVKDRRRKRRKAEAEHKARVEAKEFDEVADNIDRAWSERGVVASRPEIPGFGPGRKGYAGKYVWRDGKLVRRGDVSAGC